MSLIISFLIVLLLTMLHVAFGIQLFEVPNSESIHFGLTTICSIFGGFLFNNYNLLFNFSDSEQSEKIRKTEILKKRNKHITQGISSAVLSIIAGLLLSITYNKNVISILDENISCGSYVLYCIEIIFLFTTIYFFIRSSFEMKQIVEVKISSTDKIDKKTINNIKEQLRNHD